MLEEICSCNYIKKIAVTADIFKILSCNYKKIIVTAEYFFVNTKKYAIFAHE